MKSCLVGLKAKKRKCLRKLKMIVRQFFIQQEYMCCRAKHTPTRDSKI